MKQHRVTKYKVLKISARSIYVAKWETNYHTQQQQKVPIWQNGKQTIKHNNSRVEVYT